MSAGGGPPCRAESGSAPREGHDQHRHPAADPRHPNGLWLWHCESTVLYFHSVTESAPPDPRTRALDDLETWRRWSQLRDPLVLAALETGATWKEIERSSGLSSQTINAILKAARITHPSPQEVPMPTIADPAKHYPHHPHLVSSTQSANRREYRFRPFNGTEPEPTLPEYPSEGSEEQREEWRLRSDEIHAARRGWRVATFTREITPLLRKAVPAWKTYVDAQAQLDLAWSELDNPPHSYPVSVKKVLDAHRAVDKAAQRWEWDHAEAIASIESSYSEREQDDGANWRDAARGLGITDASEWNIGWTFEKSYEPSLITKVERLIEEQRRRLKDIAGLSGTQVGQSH